MHYLKTFHSMFVYECASKRGYAYHCVHFLLQTHTTFISFPTEPEAFVFGYLPTPLRKQNACLQRTLTYYSAIQLNTTRLGRCVTTNRKCMHSFDYYSIIA